MSMSHLGADQISFEKKKCVASWKNGPDIPAFFNLWLNPNSLLQIKKKYACLIIDLS